jgi:hypothetical protein
MNWAAWGPTIISIVVGIVVIGKTIGRIDNQEKTLAQHDDRIVAVEDKTAAHDIAIAKSEAWREGFKAGKTEAESHQR